MDNKIHIFFFLTVFALLSFLAYRLCVSFIHAYQPMQYWILNLLISSVIATIASRTIQRVHKGLSLCVFANICVAIFLNIIFYYAGARDVPDSIALELLIPTLIAGIVYPIALCAWLPSLAIFFMLRRKKI
jgi:hypothetical protein